MGKFKKASPKRKKRVSPSRNGSIIFYTLYVLLLLAFAAGLYHVNDQLTRWLTRYEDSQPSLKAQEVFDRHFANPQWSDIYELIGMEDSTFEGSEAFVTCMESLVGGGELSYSESFESILGDRRYFIRLGQKTLGQFTLTDISPEGVPFPEWELGTVELTVPHEVSVRIQKLDGHTVFVNGVALDDSYTMKITSTAVENYLHYSANGLHLYLQQVDGLMTEPEISILDENGEPCEVTFNAETGIYEEAIPQQVMSEEDEKIIRTAAEGYVRYMVHSIDEEKLAGYIDENSDLYDEIIAGELWVENLNSYKITELIISDFFRYSDSQLSARITLCVETTDSDGIDGRFQLDTTVFMEKQRSGKWLIYKTTKANIHKLLTRVRLTFLHGEDVLLTNFYESNVAELVAPVLTVPEGQRFLGWGIATVDENGNETMTLIFTPDEHGNVTIPDGNELQPMILHALFEPIETENGGSK